MKRICSIILMLCMAFSMAACNSKVPDPIIPPTIPTADPTEPTAAPTEPTVAPTDPTDPTEPTEPTNPTFPTEPAPSVDLSKVLEVDLGLMEWPKFNHKNQISQKNEHFIDEKAEQEKVFTINGVACNLTYDESVHFPMGDRIGHVYTVNGDEDKSIVLDDKGNLMMILYAYTKLNISPMATPEEVLTPLKAELSKILDLSYYNDIFIPTGSQYTDGSVFYYYGFRHKVDGYITDSFTVAVKNDGSVLGLKIVKLATVDFKLNIDEEKAEKLLVAKLKNIYNTETTQYQSHYLTSVYIPELTKAHSIVQYKGQLYIRYNVYVTYLHAEYGENSDNEQSILIPLEELSK